MTRLCNASRVAAILILLLPSPALAHSGATGIVKERMDLMKDIGRATKIIAAMFQGKQDYDANAVQAAAEVIAGLGGAAMTDKFPSGSLDKPSEALPEIWRDWQRFERLANTLKQEAALLAQQAPNGPGGFGQPDLVSQAANAPAGPAATRMLATCKACHDDFRKED